MHKLISCLALVFFAFILWVIYLANAGQSSYFFKLVGMIPHGDKVGHFMLFGLLTLFVNIATKCRCLSLGEISIYWGSLAVWLFVTIEEFSQHFIPTRTLDIYDYLADLIGITIFSLLSFVYQRRLNA